MLQSGGGTFRWTDDCQNAFDALKRALTEPPVLALPIDGALYILDTDASNVAIGAVVNQVWRRKSDRVCKSSFNAPRAELLYDA